MMKNSSGRMKDDQQKYGVFSFLVMPFQPTASTDTYLYSTYTDLYILYIFFRYYPISFCDCAASSLPLSFVYLVLFVRSFFSSSTFECFKKSLFCTNVCCYEKPSFEPTRRIVFVLCMCARVR